MLAIRLQRTGRSGHAQFRLIVQDSRFSPVRGRVVAYLGSYDPHTKQAAIDSQKAADYLEKGAQPSDRAARLLQKEGVKLPKWVNLSQPKKRTVRNADKRRSTRPTEPVAPASAVAESAETTKPPTQENVTETETLPDTEPVAQEESTETDTIKPKEEKQPEKPTVGTKTEADSEEPQAE